MMVRGQAKVAHLALVVVLLPLLQQLLLLAPKFRNVFSGLSVCHQWDKLLY
jgi:hypothetical protein